MIPWILDVLNLWTSLEVGDVFLGAEATTAMHMVGHLAMKTLLGMTGATLDLFCSGGLKLRFSGE